MALGGFECADNFYYPLSIWIFLQMSRLLSDKSLWTSSMAHWEQQNEATNHVGVFHILWPLSSTNSKGLRDDGAQPWKCAWHTCTTHLKMVNAVQFLLCMPYHKVKADLQAVTITPNPGQSRGGKTQWGSLVLRADGFYFPTGLWARLWALPLFSMDPVQRNRGTLAKWNVNLRKENVKSCNHTPLNPDLTLMPPIGQELPSFQAAASQLLPLPGALNRCPKWLCMCVDSCQNIIPWRTVPTVLK